MTSTYNNLSQNQTTQTAGNTNRPAFSAHEQAEGRAPGPLLDRGHAQQHNTEHGATAERMPSAAEIETKSSHPAQDENSELKNQTANGFCARGPKQEQRTPQFLHSKLSENRKQTVARAKHRKGSGPRQENESRRNQMRAAETENQAQISINQENEWKKSSLL
jgi:hypothetical protein